MSQFSDLPAPPNCPETGAVCTECNCDCCEEIASEYATVKVTRVCAASSPADVIVVNPSDSNPKDDNTFDCISQNIVIPAVGDNFVMVVANSSIYKVGQWVQFISPSATYQIVALDHGTNTITLKNSQSDGATEIPGNPSPGSTITSESCFIIRSAYTSISDEEKLADTETAITNSENICFDSVPQQQDGEPSYMFGISGTSACNCGDDEGNRSCIIKPHDDAPKMVDGTFTFSAPEAAIASTGGFKVGFLNVESGNLQWAGTIDKVNSSYNIVTNASGVPRLEVDGATKFWRLSTRQVIFGNALADGTVFLADKNVVDVDDFAIPGGAAAIPSGATHVRLYITVKSSGFPDYNRNAYVLDKFDNILSNANPGSTSTNCSSSCESVVLIDDPEGTPTFRLKYVSQYNLTGDYEPANLIHLNVQLIGYDKPIFI